MNLSIRKADAPLLSAIVPLSYAIPSTVVSNGPFYQGLVARVPDWLFWVSFGFAVAAWLFDPWRKESRVREVWQALTDKFSVEHLHAGHWGQWDADGSPMPETDIGVRLRIRFTRTARNIRLRLRVFSCTGQGRKPFEHVIPLGTMDAVKGEILDIPVVDMGLSGPGWDHMRKRGWGPKKEHDLIGKSRNVVVLECQGNWLTQVHRFFVEMVNHDTGLGRYKPSLYMQEEQDDIWDVSDGAKTGIWKYYG